MNHSRPRRRGKGASYPGLEIIAKLATVLEVQPAELLRVPARKRKHSEKCAVIPAPTLHAARRPRNQRSSQGLEAMG
jgi:hypothetical protein